MRLTVGGSRRPIARLRGAGCLLAGCLAVVASSACGSVSASTLRVASARGSSRLATTSRSGPSPSTADWLGLDQNSSTSIGKLDGFAARRIVYDRSGRLELNAGQTVARTPKLARGVRRSLEAGMVPDIEIDPVAGPVGCQGDPNGPSLRCLPATAADVKRYATGFVRTASSIRRAHPRARILLEPMNEPWNWASPPGTPSGRTAAFEYAAVLRRLLPAAKAAGIPLSEIYVPGTGQLSDGTFWIPDLYQAQPCLRPGPRSCGPIAGWNLHPYGRPGSQSEGIDSVPGLRPAMRSGANNILVSEIGFCASDVAGGLGCGLNSPEITGTSGQAAAWLGQTLIEALAMRRAGWLRGLLIWSRGGDGWGMQNADGTLTAQGRVLTQFASRYGRLGATHSVR